MKKYSTRNTLLFVLFMLTFLGVWVGIKFSSKDKKVDNESDRDSKGHKTEQSEDTKTNVIEKMNQYARCFNRNNQRAGDSYRRYLSWVDKEKGPTGKEQNVYGLYTIYGSEYYCDKMEETLKMSPIMPSLDEKAKKYVKEMESLHAFLLRVDKYYDHQDYKDDNFAGAKEMHPQIIAAFKSYFDAADDFERVYADLSAQQTGIWEVHSQKIIQNAIELRTYMKKANADKLHFAELVKNYADAIEEVELNNPDFVKEKGSFMSYANEFLKLTKELNRNIQSGKGADKAQYSTWLNRYVNLIDNYNRLGDKYLKLLEVE